VEDEKDEQKRRTEHRVVYLIRLKYLSVCLSQHHILGVRPGRGVDACVELIVPTVSTLFACSSGQTDGDESPAARAELIHKSNNVAVLLVGPWMVHNLDGSTWDSCVESWSEACKNPFINSRA
jgi:hypothetical protein